MNPTVRYVFETRRERPTPEQFASSGSLSFEAGAGPVGGFVNSNGHLCLLWRFPVRNGDISRSPSRDRPASMELVAPTGRSRLAKGEISPRAFAWFSVELRDVSSDDWARRWDGGPDALLERSGALLLGVFVDGRVQSRHAALLVAAHRHSELESAWRRLSDDGGFRSRIARPVLRGVAFADATRLSPLPWSEIQ